MTSQVLVFIASFNSEEISSWFYWCTDFNLRYAPFDLGESVHIFIRSKIQEPIVCGRTAVKCKFLLSYCDVKKTFQVTCYLEYSILK